jgi:amphi-Trp domain-containing protein
VDLIEISEKERLSREEAAARLRALADALARHNEVEFERGGLRFKVHVPDEVEFKLEIEVGDDEARARGRDQVVTEPSAASPPGA